MALFEWFARFASSNMRGLCRCAEAIASRVRSDEQMPLDACLDGMRQRIL